MEMGGHRNSFSRCIGKWTADLLEVKQHLNSAVTPLLEIHISELFSHEGTCAIRNWGFSKALGRPMAAET